MTRRVELYDPKNAQIREAFEHLRLLLKPGESNYQPIALVGERMIGTLYFKPIRKEKS